ncbi:MAG: hypothetical protein WAO35_22625 [Terriglobia bacterium]
MKDAVIKRGLGAVRAVCGAPGEPAPGELSPPADTLAPLLEEIKASLPPGVRLVNYQPKVAPFTVAPISVVTDAGKFFRAYIADLGWRLRYPELRAAPPLADILSKLAEGGLELAIEPAPLVITDDDIGF